MTVLERTWVSSLIATTLVIIVMMLLEMRSNKYEEIRQLEPHIEGTYRTAYFPSRNYLELLFKLNASDPMRVAIILSKELKNLLRLKIQLRGSQSSAVKLKFTTVNGSPVAEHDYRDVLTGPKPLKDVIERIEDQELKMFLLEPHEWARTYFKPPSRSIFMNYFKTRYLVENADAFIRILAKARKYLGFRDENVMLWDEQSKKESLAVMKRQYYRLVAENALSGLGALITYGTFLLLTITFVLLAYFTDPLFLMLILIQFGLFMLSFIAARLINKKRQKRIKELAHEEQQVGKMPSSSHRTKESEFKDEDLLQLRYF